MSYIISSVKDNNYSEQSVGGKAKTLIELKDLGFNVPDFFTISSEIKDIYSIREDILSAYDNLQGVIAVRSSAVGEDGVKKSFAGQYKSMLNVSKEGLMDAIKECRESLNSAHAVLYSQGDVLTKMGIIVQKMIFADISGVAFSADPVRNDKSVIVIESVNGTCESLVSGDVTPDHYVINKDKIEELNVSEDIKRVAEVVKEIESNLGYFVDVEWAIQGGVLYVLQARPITTLVK